MIERRKEYSGIIIPVVTPFDDNGKIDIPALERIIENFNANDCETLLFGTTGETASIPQSAKTKAVAALQKYIDQHRIYVAISDNCFEDAVTAANRYFDSGVEAVVVLLPGYYPLTHDQMLNYYERFVKAIHGKMFIYNIPATTHMSIPLTVIEKLSHHERIIGLKDSERGMERLQQSIELWANREDFSYFIGWGAQSFNGLWSGVDGIVPSTGNFNAPVYKDMYQAVINRDKENAELCQNISMEIASVYQKDKILGQSLPALKVMMNEAGLCGKKVTLPFTKLPENEEKMIHEQTRHLIDKYDLTWS
ncbi:MAG: dihydrodipicolinate synthase family protein [candidate division KSB1 bacterium]|nr:dihydrodipicolinate synthase family protein [candidate division KSB1 bacterium]